MNIMHESLNKVEWNEVQIKCAFWNILVQMMGTIRSGLRFEGRGSTSITQACNKFKFIQLSSFKRDLEITELIVNL